MADYRWDHVLIEVTSLVMLSCGSHYTVFSVQAKGLLSDLHRAHVMMLYVM